MNTKKLQTFDEQGKLSPLLKGTLAGFLASIIGAIVYALYPFIFGMQLNLLAIGVGGLIGFAISLFGNGKSKLLGIIGAILALISCITGDVISIIAIYSFQNSVSFWRVIGNLDFASVVDILSQTTGFLSIMFYLMAMTVAYGISTMPPLSSVSKNTDKEIN
ncbi:MAG: hypothetical protein KJZ72_07980 [Anaerolineales bacterium]|nr:hypothetical protein [Anaerolineales bacterium]